MFEIVDRLYAPRGFNRHATGVVFDLDFMIWSDAGETSVGAEPKLNPAALQGSVGMWLNLYAMRFYFDWYDTASEIWYMEYRNPKP